MTEHEITEQAMTEHDASATEQTVTEQNVVRVSLEGRCYDILIGRDILQAAVAYAARYQSGGIVVLSDSNVWAKQGKMLEEKLNTAGVMYSLHLLEPGEGSKSLAVLEQVCGSFVRFGLRRNGLVVAFGGGVVGDFAGFAASVWMRGCDFIQIPTTLLSQIDSSVGGKTAVNLQSGKNLVGTFYQPRFVVADIDLLDTLPDREWRCGIAEMVKYGALFSESLFKQLTFQSANQGAALSTQTANADYPEGEHLPENDDAPRKLPFPEKSVLPSMIACCCRLKRDVVQEDEQDTGRRMLLNFGHTFGHAVEKLGGFSQYNHGEAVAVGMMVAAAYGEWIGFTQTGCMNRLQEALRTWQLQTDCPYDANEMLLAMEQDKKVRDGGVDLILLKNIGHAEKQWVSMKDMRIQLPVALRYLKNGGVDETVKGFIIREDS